MVYCAHCQEDCNTVRDHDGGYICCADCGRVIDQDFFADEPTFTKDSSGQSRLAGNIMRSMESSYSVSRERTLEKGRDEIQYIVDQLMIGGGVDEAHKLYTIAVDKSFTRGRRTSHVASACIYIHCRCNKKPFLLIDFSNLWSTSVYVLGAVFLQLCELLRLAAHPFIQTIVDPSLFIHRFTDRLLGQQDPQFAKQFAKTAMYIVASMKRDWMQTGRKPSGLCGAAMYITALSYGLNYSKSDIVTVVHICEATLTKRLVEFENTESGGLTIVEFLTRAEEEEKYKDETYVPSKLPIPGEVLCEHKDKRIPHFAHGLCKKCFDDFGGLEGGTEPPAFQRAERQRIERAHEQEKMNELSVEEMEAGIPKIDSDLTQYKLLASKEQESQGHQVADTSTCDGQPYLESSAKKDPESLSDIDDSEVDVYLHNKEETRYKRIVWEKMNKEYLEEQAAKEAFAANGEAVVKPKKKRKQKTAEEAKDSSSADTPLEATRQMLKKKTFRVNYEALEGLYTMDNEKVKKQEGESETGDANGKVKKSSGAGDLQKGDDTGSDFEEIDYDHDYDYAGNEDGSYTYDDAEFEEA